MAGPDGGEKSKAAAPAFAGTPRFERLRELGSGGMGVVYEVLDRASGERLALKTLQDFDADRLLRLKAEFRALQGLHHHNLIGLGELQEHDGVWFFTMELVDGVPLDRYVRLDRGGPDADASSDDATGATRVGSPPDSTGSRALEADDLPTMLDAPPGQDQLATVIEAPPEPLAPTLIEADARTMLEGPPPGASAPAASADAAPPRERSAPLFDETRLRSVFGQVALGLHALHRAGKLHLDLKPSNVLVTREGRAVILDFGLVREQQRSIDRREESDGDGRQVRISGTPAYMPLEQMDGHGGEVGEAADWYAFGITLYQALTGRVPFEGGVLQILHAKVRRDPLPPSALVDGVPADLERLCLSLLAREPDERPVGEQVLHALGIRPPDSMSTDGAAGATDGPLVGRTEELRRLLDLFARSREAGPVVVIVGGPSGVGKSALIHRALEMLKDAEDALVVTGRCYERESVPFKTVDSLLDSLSSQLKRLGAERRAALRPEHAGALARLFPVVSRAFGPAPGEADEPVDPHLARRRAATALKDLLRGLAALRPLVLFIDDVQWGDSDGAVLLAEALSQPDPPPLLLVVSHRPDEAGSEAVREALLRPVQQDLLAAPVELTVAPLSKERSRQLALALIGRDTEADRALAEQIARESEGNPFFVGELVRYLQSASGSLLEAGVTLDALIGLRIDRLEPEARKLLETIVVASRPVEQGIALRAAGVARTTGGALDVLRAGRLVRTAGPRDEDPVETFHDRIRAGVLARIAGATRLPAIHAGLARELEARGVSDAEWLAAHWEGAGERGRATELLLAAARRAEQALALERAARLYERVLELTEQAGRAPDPELVEACGDACLQAGHYEEAGRRYAQRLPAVTEPAARSELLRKAAEVEYRRGRTVRSGEMLEEVLRTLGFAVPRSRLALLARLAWGVGRAMTRVLNPFTLRGARARAEASGLGPVVARVCNRLAEAFYWTDLTRAVFYQYHSLNVAFGIGRCAELTTACAQLGYAMSTFGQRRLGARFLALARRSAGDDAGPAERAWTEVMEGMARACRGDVAGHLEHVQRADALVADFAEPMLVRTVWTNHGEALMVAGRTDAARHMGMKVWQLADRIADDRGRGWSLVLLGLSALRRERTEQAVRALRESEAASGRGEDILNQVTVRGRLTLALALAGDHEEALALGRRTTALLAGSSIRHPTHVAFGTFLAAAALRRAAGGEIDLATRKDLARARRRGARFARQLAYTAPLYHAGRAAWDLQDGRADRAREGFERAVAAAERSGLRGELHDVHALGAAIWPEDTPERAAHVARRDVLRAD